MYNDGGRNKTKPPSQATIGRLMSYSKSKECCTGSAAGLVRRWFASGGKTARTPTKPAAAAPFPSNEEDATAIYIFLPPPPPTNQFREFPVVPYLALALWLRLIRVPSPHSPSRSPFRCAGGRCQQTAIKKRLKTVCQVVWLALWPDAVVCCRKYRF
jgi:hypothetical protein